MTCRTCSHSFRQPRSYSGRLCLPTLPMQTAVLAVSKQAWYIVTLSSIAILIMGLLVSWWVYVA